MDPNATVNEIEIAMEDQDWEQARYLAEDLLTWLDNGGFPPSTMSGTEAYAYASWVLEQSDQRLLMLTR